METFKTQDGTVITYTNGKVDITKPVGRWKAKAGEIFYFLDCDGDIGSNTYTPNFYPEEYRYNTLNMFKTKEEADSKREYDLAIGTLTHAIEELNGGWKPCWEDREQQKWSMYYDECRYFTEWDASGRHMTILPFCKTEEIAQEIIDKYSKELDILRTYQS